MSRPPVTRTFFLSSETAWLARNGSEATFTLDNPIDVPRDSYPEVAVSEATVWYTTPNVGPAFSNNHFYYTDDAAAPTKYNITMLTGLYDEDAFNARLSVGLLANGHPADLFQLQGDSSANRFSVVKAVSTTPFMFTFAAGTPYAMLGFALNATVPSNGTPTTAAISGTGTLTADLNAVETYLLHCDLTNGYTYANGTTSAALITIQPDKPAGYRLLREPINVEWYPAPRLAGGQLSQITIWLTDQSGERGTIDTNGDPFGCTLKLRF